LPLPPLDDGDLQQLARSWARSLEDRDLSPNTIYVYLTGLKIFGEFLAELNMPTSVAALSREHLREFFRWLRDQGRSDNTRASRFRALSAFFKWLVEEGEIGVSPLHGLHRPTVQVPPPPIMPDVDVKRLLDTCAGNDFVSRRDLAIIRLFFDIGVRRSGLAYMRTQDVHLNMSPPAVTIVGKGQHVYTPAIGRKAAMALDRYLRARARHKFAKLDALWLGRQGPLGDGAIDLMLRRRGLQAGVEIHAHMFRHLFAHANLSDPEVKEGDVLEQGGWRDPNMLRRYARSAAAERARQAHARRDLGSRL
jgi:site-specific recombinase XerC